MNNTILRLRHLRRYDKELWVPEVTRTIKSELLPSASKESCVRENGSIFYRGVYYFSHDRNYPFVRFETPKKLGVPLVTACTKKSYDEFLEQRLNGEFVDVEAWVCLPISYHNDKSDL